MRAKVRITSVTKSSPASSAPAWETLKFMGVGKSDGYPADGKDEDNSYALWTPSLELSMTVTNPDLFGKFTEGQKLYLDFTPAE